ncbi:MAG: GDP-mannose 4,6-dehydratase [Bacteriovoracia bacterium]
MAKPVALITGISGQDGSYLSELLLKNGYRVVGITRDPARRFSLNIAHLEGKIELVDSSYETHHLAEILAAVKPTEVYNFAGQVYVSKSWEMVDETFRASGVIPTHLLEAILKVDRSIRYFQASSSEIFYPSGDTPLTEATPLAPYNPYGCTKAYAHHMVTSYRRNYGLFAVNGVFFNHESPRRHENFAAKKAVRAAVRIKLGKEKTLQFGNASVIRDFGYAPDYVDACWRMLKAAKPEDYLICTGQSYSLEHVLRSVFGRLGLDFEKHVQADPRYFRLHEPLAVYGSSAKIRQDLGWKPTVDLEQMLDRMIQFEMKFQQGLEKDYAHEHPV